MYESIPQELKKLRQWVCWEGVPDEKRPGKLKKVPIDARSGNKAKSNDPGTWTDYDTAVQVSSKYSGIGFMFAPPYFGVDIDGVDNAIEDFKAGHDDNIIAEFVHTLCCYAEYSVSGKGIHIICRGQLPPTGRRRGNVEMYQDGRFFTMTGNDAAGYVDIEDCTEKIKPLHEKYIGAGKEPTTGINVIPISLSDREVVEAARRSKQGAMFTDLYEGRWDGYFNSQSEADMSFSNMLAFWCRCDVDLMDRIFRSSGLMREKWDRRQSGSTYGALTLQKAVKDCNKVYEPAAQYGITIGRSKPPKKPKLYSFDDMGNADRLAEAFGERVRYSYVDKCWYYYDDRRWCKDQSGVISRLCDELIEEMKHGLKDYLRQPCDQDDMEKQFAKHLKYSRSNKGKKAMIAETMHHVPIMPEQMDQHNSLLNTTNGVLHLRTGTLTEHDPALYLSKMTLCEFTDKIDCPQWEAFLQDIFGGDEELIRYIQKAVGYSLTGSTAEQCAFFCYGTGRNGKSTFLDTLSAMLGNYAVNIQPETLAVRNGMSSGANSDIARLKGARLVTSVEPNEGMRLNEGLVKQLTGGDRVTARHLYGNEFEFTPEFKLWMSTNYKPVIRGTDTGIWRRVHLIPFTMQIPEDKADKHLPHRLRGELTGILRWAVDGCLMWQREGLKKPAAVEAAVKEYRGEMDVVSTWLDACCEVGLGREKTTELYQSYANWADENNEYKLSSRKFGQEMAKKFERSKSNGACYYSGLTLLDASRPYQIHFGG